RYKETPESVLKQIEEVKVQLEQGCSRAEIQSLMPAGAARNAVDCALWDLDAKKLNRRAYEIARLGPLQSVQTAYTISLASPDKMFEAAQKESHRPLLKIKLGAPEGDLERIYAVRKAAPRAKLIADANEGWTGENINSHMMACNEMGYSLIEQPLPSS